MTTHIEFIISAVCIIIFTPIALVLLNISGYTKLETSTYTKITSEDFNILTLSGLKTAINFFIDFSRFTIDGLGWFWISFFTVFELIMLGVLFLFVRGVN